jgi:hypothetical protein
MNRREPRSPWRCRATFGICAAAILFGVQPTRAQDTYEPMQAAQFREGAPPKTFGQWHFGSVYFTPTIVLRQLGVDTNVRNERYEPKADFTATVAPQLGITYVGPKIKLQATPEVAFIYYHSFPHERATNPSVRINGGFALTKKVSFFTNQFYGYVKSRPNFEIDERVRRRVAQVTAGVRFKASKRLALSLSGQTYQTYFEHQASFEGVDLAHLMNMRRNEAGTEVEFALTPYTQVFGRFRVDTERFPNYADRSADSSWYSGGLRFGSRAAIKGEAEIGKRIRKSLTALPDVQTTTLRGLIYSNLRDHTRLSVAATRLLDYSYRVESPYYTSQTYSGTLSQSLFRRVDTDVTYIYQGRDYGRFLSSETIGGSTVEVSRGYRLSLGFRLRPGFRIAVYGMHWDRNAELSPYRTYRGWNLGFTFGSFRGNDMGIYANEIRP